MSLLEDDGLLDLRPRAKGTDAAAVVAEEARARRQAPEANDALLQAAPTAPAGQGCHVCAAAPKAPCTACGRPACAAHRWAMFGLCTACATEERIARWHNQPRPEERNWLDPA